MKSRCGSLEPDLRWKCVIKRQLLCKAIHCKNTYVDNLCVVMHGLSNSFYTSNTFTIELSAK